RPLLPGLRFPASRRQDPAGGDRRLHVRDRRRGLRPGLRWRGRSRAVSFRPMVTPILMLGAGRMGGAMVEGWLAAGAFAPQELMIRDPQPGPSALAAQAAGAVLNPPEADLARARTVVLAVKPQVWRDVAAEAAPWI